jgi:hypothetical protein
MKALLTLIAVSANIGALAGLYLSIGEPISDLTAPISAGVFTLSTLALLAKAGR